MADFIPSTQIGDYGIGAPSPGDKVDAGAGTYCVQMERGGFVAAVGTAFKNGTASIRLLQATAFVSTVCTFDGQSSKVISAEVMSNAYLIGTASQIISGGTQLYADRRSAIRVATAPTGGPTYSPALGTIGNNEAYIS